MIDFKDLGITSQPKNLIGDKIKIDRLFNRPIVIEAWRIMKSKYPEQGNGMCLQLQFKLNDEQRVVFTTGIYLQDMISRVPKESFPFKTTIVKHPQGLQFT